MSRTDRGSGYGLSMPPLVAPANFSIKLVFGMFLINDVTKILNFIIITLQILNHYK